MHWITFHMQSTIRNRKLVIFFSTELNVVVGLFFLLLFSLLFLCIQQFNVQSCRSWFGPANVYLPLCPFRKLTRFVSFRFPSLNNSNLYINNQLLGFCLQANFITALRHHSKHLTFLFDSFRNC